MKTSGPGIILVDLLSEQGEKMATDDFTNVGIIKTSAQILTFGTTVRGLAGAGLSLRACGTAKCVLVLAPTMKIYTGRDDEG